MLLRMCQAPDQVEYEQRVSAGLAAMSDAERKAVLAGAFSSVTQDRGGWAVIDELGISLGYATKREAEDSIIEGTGMFD